MRIAHIITRMIVGGAQENTLLNCLDLVRIYGDDVLLITGPSLGPEGSLLESGRYAVTADEGSATESSTPADPSPAESRAGGLKISLVPALRRAINPIHDATAYLAIKRRLREFQPDVVHTHSAKAGILGRLAAWQQRVPAIVHTVHGAPFHPYQNRLVRRFYRDCEKIAASRCHKLISVADAMTELMVEAAVAPRDKFTTIYSGMEVEPFLAADEHRREIRGRFDFEDDDMVVGKIARLFPLKGHEYLIAAAGEVVRENPRVKFLLVGDGILRGKLAADIAARGLSQHFRFAGLVPPDQVPAMLGAMDMLVHSSLREGLARTLPQALIAGRPVISYDIDGAREVVIDGETGFLLPPRSIEPLAAAIVRLADDSEMRRRLGEQGRARFTDVFRHQTMTEQIRSVYQQLVERADR